MLSFFVFIRRLFWHGWSSNYFGDMDHYFAECGRTLVVQCVQLINNSWLRRRCQAIWRTFTLCSSMASNSKYIYSQALIGITTFETQGLELLSAHSWTRQSKSMQYRKSVRRGGSNAESYGAFTARGVSQSKPWSRNVYIKPIRDLFSIRNNAYFYTRATQRGSHSFTPILLTTTDASRLIWPAVHLKLRSRHAKRCTHAPWNALTRRRSWIRS